MKAADAMEETPALSLGWIVGGSTLANKPLDDAIRELTIRIGEAGRGIEAPLNLNVVFQVPGNMLKPEFVGVRTGRFSKPRALLMVQVAVPEEVPLDPRNYLKGTIHAAIDEAARWAVKRKVPIDVSKLFDILERA
ncbi:hypothetical protein [Dyella nitratireducens]|uniref:Uncharacterized protein n=1 Tax=Dyella nitratireducens TaxID=1849580 RepID=A0ABQ1FKP8_9GAMM|nr:hypothetical protein [Dyella nitratireducens]GGA16847.1 hypothetical protein GCM10010981_00700 [Dyella nitratireducens]GLQ44869.1 hypothetical protein GCM10007902_47190 [Dyella nitratireducens]